ncbi:MULTISPECIES: LPS export ABC transporter periplasmic protein LptC [Stenotrophomonas]|uniref:LPS export ABC transporter periplasmic protein LptC n=1 Tax=Stenotrophomonas TaxID=40323 RepID=UPI001F06842A|nr:MULTISPECIES: LPS export ABC transporter periplasmic protein LptC [Stenotrophomonas]MCH1907656.1 LPS export ABC transporter periplasmic protein LptC [Stenotrophomonas sp. Y6]WPU56863.1 LPS export ABC transporter periplasmic protein LptC [Stenotrophomonas acidaminiphila]
MNWRMLIGTGLLLAALASGWSAWRHRATLAPAGASQVRADYVLGDFEIVTLDKDGKEAATLRAPSMERNASDQTSVIARPLFLLPDAEGRHWQLRADTGWVSAKGDELRLRGNVAGDSPEQGGTPPTTFRTTALDVFPERSLARTAEPVTMARPGLRQSGVGFEADLKSRQYSLLSQVKTRYEPNAARQAR